MSEIKLIPKFPFSFNNWCYGYIFSQLYQINSTEYANSFYIKNNNKTWFISSVFNYPEKPKPTDYFSITNRIYEYNKDNKLHLIANPDDMVLKKVKETINHYLGLQDDLTNFYKFVEEFEEIRKIRNVLPGYRLSSVLLKEWMPVFAYLSTNTTVDMFHTFLEKFLEHWGINVPYGTYSIPSFHVLENLIPLKEEDYRTAKVGYRAKYLPEMIQQLLSKSYPLDYNFYDYEQDDKNILLKQLKKIKGVGDYSARTILLYGLKDFSVGFVDSFIKIIMNHYFKTDRKISNNELQKIIDDKFYPYQGLMIDWLCAVYSYTTKTNKDKFFVVKKKKEGSTTC